MRRHALTLAALLLVTGPLTVTGALAQDDPAPPGPGKDSGPVVEEKEPERKTSKEAEQALERYAKLLHLPAHGKTKELTSTAGAEGQVLPGGKLEVTPRWTAGKGLTLDVTIPEEIKARYPAQQLDMTKKLFQTWARETLSPVFESPSLYVADYHVTHKKESLKDIVELMPFNDRAAAERQVLYFNMEGLVERRSMIAKVDPTDPMQAMLAGAEIDTTYGYERRGDRHVITRMSSLMPIGDMLVEYTYYDDLPDDAVLLKTCTIVTPFDPTNPIVITFTSYEADGKVIEATKPMDAPVETPSGEDEKPVEDGEKKPDGE